MTAPLPVPVDPEDPTGIEADLDEVFEEVVAEVMTRHPGADEAAIRDAVATALEAGFQLGQDFEYTHPD